MLQSYLPRDFVAILLVFLLAVNPLLTITIVLGALHSAAGELHRVGAGYVIDNLLLHVTIRSLHIGALVVILGSGVDLIGGVADPVLPSETPLYLVSLLQSLIVDCFNQATHKLVDIEADSVYLSINKPSTVLVSHCITCVCIRSPACLLCVGNALILEHDLLHLVAVGVLVDSIPTHVSLANIRIVPLGRAWCGVLGTTSLLTRTFSTTANLNPITRSYAPVTAGDTIHPTHRLEFLGTHAVRSRYAEHMGDE